MWSSPDLEQPPVFDRKHAAELRKPDEERNAGVCGMFYLGGMLLKMLLCRR